MADWIKKLDDFLRLSEREILTHAGTVSHDDAVLAARREYTKFSAQRAALQRRHEGVSRALRAPLPARPASACEPVTRYPQTSTLPLPPHVCPAGQVPQSMTLPQPSVARSQS